MMTDYKNGLQKRAANYTPLSPTSLVTRAAIAYPEAPAVTHGGVATTWLDTYNRTRRIASALRAGGASPLTTVAALCRNIPAAVELTYAVPMSGAVLNMINSRLDATAVAFILDHGEAEFFFVDMGLADVAMQALSKCRVKPKVIAIEVDEPAQDISGVNYEQFFEDAPPLCESELLPSDELNALALNYTSGTTGDPKGVVTHHRGAYLAAIGNTLEWPMLQHPRYLWTLPLFHCNGWNFPWTIAAKAGVNVCLPTFTPATIIDAIIENNITHLCGAPIVVNMAVGELERRSVTLENRVAVMTAGAAPPAAVLERAEKVGFDLTHTYGLTEVYGPVAICAWRQEWDDLPAAERAAKKARQGVRYVVLEELSVRDPKTMEETPHDGETIGEVMFRGNVVMSGYLKNLSATEKAFDCGQFHSGDLGVRHSDGHIELKDRSKDIIISGGENISSIEVESVLYKHPAVSEAAVVAVADKKWGETPVACIELKEGASLNESQLIAFCRERLAHFKCPTRVLFKTLPKTATGKIRKFDLRESVKKEILSS